MNPIYGLVLAGGLSSRMKRDKATLAYQGQTQLDRTVELAARHCAKTFVSVRAAQVTDPLRAAHPMLVDSVPGEGPIAGIRSAIAAHPQVAWLVIACDLPFLSDAALGHLLRERDSSRLATAFSSAHDNLPEPLCAVWEPAAGPALDEYQAGGGKCPRKFLIRNSVKLLEPLDRRALDNANTPDEYAAALTAFGVNPVKLQIQYFALMREQAGKSNETVESAAATPADLYGELVARYGFTLTREQLKVAVNSEFSDWSRQLAAGDEVVFIPPVAGG